MSAKGGSKEGEIPKVRVSSFGGREGSFELKGLTREEMSSMEGMALGHRWVRVGEDGRLATVDSRLPLPKPYEDEEMTPFWNRPISESPIQLEMAETFFSGARNQFSSIMIQSLCSYSYSVESYATYAKILESYGFECLRSRRGEDGKFWEIWLLPSLWFAKGELAIFLEELEKKGQKTNDEETQEAVCFLARNVIFGTLDVCIQRLAFRLD